MPPEMLMPYLKFLIKCFKIALTLAEVEVDLLSIFDSLKRNVVALAKLMG